MTSSTKDFVSVLNNLVETCKDGEQGFREAAEGVQNSTLRSVFNEYSRQRSQFASELQMEITRIGGDAEKSGSVAGAMHRGWINLKSAITGKDDHAILEEAERGEDAAVKAYHEGLSKDLPSDLQSIVQRQYQSIHDAHLRIRSMRDSSEYRGTVSSSKTSQL